MPERRSWSQEEDRVLRELKEQRGEKKWSLIARKMAQEFALPGRTGKQCRERYHNHLDASIVRTEWTPQEEDTLFALHEEVGNKWSVIALRLPGRSDNCVKNHFYSRLRKSIRRINKLPDCPRPREVKLSLLYKLIETTEERFKDNSRLDELTLARCASIKNRLFRYADAPLDSLAETALLKDLLWFEAKTRRPGKYHKGSTETNYPHEDEEQDEEKREARQPRQLRGEEKGRERSEGQSAVPFYLIFKRVCEEVLLGR